MFVDCFREFSRPSRDSKVYCFVLVLQFKIFSAKVKHSIKIASEHDLFYNLLKVLSIVPKRNLKIGFFTLKRIYDSVVHTTPEKLENAALFLRLDRPFRINRVFRNRSSNASNLKKPPLRCSWDVKYFEHGPFRNL